MSGRQDEIVIAVMGGTGTGKSSFVRILSGNAGVRVGDTLESETSDVQVAAFRDSESGRRVILVDSPGFDDSREGISDTDVLKKITDFLLQTYDAKRKLNGLIYLQRISDPRFSGQSGRNLKMFRSLCGTKAYENVIVLTTFWDRLLSRQDGEKREGQLKIQYFKELLEGGAQFMRHNRDIESARAVLQHILTLVPKDVRIQEEIRLEGKTLEETAAGSVHREEVERIIAKHKKEMEEVKGELESIRRNNSTLRRELEEEQDKLRRKIARWEVERAELQMGLDEAQKGRERIETNRVKDKADYETRRKEQENRWETRFDEQKRQMDRLQQRNTDPQRQSDDAKREAIDDLGFFQTVGVAFDRLFYLQL